MYGATETSTAAGSLAATGVALTTGSQIAIAIAVIALGGLLLALRKRFVNRRGARP